MLLPRLLIAALIVALAAMSVGSATAGPSNTYVVTLANDPPPDGCQPNDCSAREAFLDANAHEGADTIQIGALQIILSITGTDDNAEKGDLDITEDVTITGVDPDNTTIDADLIDRVIDIPSPPGDNQSDAHVTISNVGVTGGNHSAIHSAGFLSLDNVVVMASTNGGGNGGGIESVFGDLVIDHSTLWKNSVIDAGKGGAIAAASPTTIRNSILFANNAANGGGAIWATGGLSLINSTVTGNGSGSGFGGAGLWIETTPSAIINSTIAKNDSLNPGGGIWNKETTVTINNTIIAGNTGGNSPDCDGTFGGDYNLIQDTDGCTLTGTNNITGADPLLFDRASYGGLSQSMAIPKESRARDSGNNCQPEDQRGIPRPQGDGCDIGAYEYAFLGDLDCGGTVAPPDITAYLGWLAIGDQPPCHYLGDLDCDLGFAAIDVLSLVRVLAQLAPLERPAYCGEIGPFES